MTIETTLQEVNAREIWESYDHSVHKVDGNSQERVTKRTDNVTRTTTSGGVPRFGGSIATDQVSRSREDQVDISGINDYTAIFIFGSSFLTTGLASNAPPKLHGTTIRAADLAKTEDNVVRRIVVFAPTIGGDITIVLDRLKQYFPDLSPEIRYYTPRDQGDYDLTAYQGIDEVFKKFVPHNTTMAFPMVLPVNRFWKRRDTRNQAFKNLYEQEADSANRLIVRAFSNDTITDLKHGSNSVEGGSNDETYSIKDGNQSVSTYRLKHGKNHMVLTPCKLEENQVGSSRNGDVEINGVHGCSGVLIFGDRLITGLHATALEEIALTELAIAEAQQEGNVVSKIVIMYPEFTSASSRDGDDELEDPILEDMKTLLVNAFHVQPIVRSYDYEDHNIVPIYNWLGSRAQGAVLEAVLQPRLFHGTTDEYTLNKDGQVIFDLQPLRIIAQDPLP